MDTRLIKKIGIAAVIIGLAVFFQYLELGQYLTLAYIKNSQTSFQVIYAEKRFTVIIIYMLIYILLTSLSLPGAAILTLAGGALFGLLAGTVIVSFASTIGATLACLVSRFLLRDWVQKKFGDKLKAVNDGIEKEGAFYLFTLRLIPIFPFFVINLAMGLTNISLFTFFWVSQIGMLAGTMVYVNAGKELAKLNSLSGILSPGLIFSFVLLGLFPITVKKFIAFYKKKYLFLIAIAFTMVFFMGSQVNAWSFDYDLYQKFLDSVIVQEKKINGFILNAVDYTSINKDKNRPESLYRKLLAMIYSFDPAAFRTKKDKVAFWINIYNISAIKMIVDHYPVDSIRSRKINWLRNPWKREIITVGGRGHSLGEIEHEILIKRLKEPRAHFAIVCASLSCPDLNAKVYRPDTLEEQLEVQARAFLSDKMKGLKIDRKKGAVYFSKIFKFDTNTFPGGAKDAVSLIAPFISKDDSRYLSSGKYKIQYFEYDWSLNDLRRAE